MSSRSHRESRSRSPYRDGRKARERTSRERQRDVHHRERDVAVPRPFDARQLTKRDLNFYRPMFALYLDIQKRLDIDGLTEDEVKGRWKSFINKWNRGELAEGWYDLSTLMRAHRPRGNNIEKMQYEESSKPMTQLQHDKPLPKSAFSVEEDRGNDGDDEYGPQLPIMLNEPSQNESISDLRQTRAGPTIPSFEDIQSRDEDARVSADLAREAYIRDIRQERLLDRKLEKSRLDEILPRAQAGTRERQLEKKREIADSNREFAASKDANGDVEIRDSDLLGGDELGELKRMKKEQERRKTEREIKREEILRARMAERGQKLKAMRDKEEKTMSMLREIAKERFGTGNDQPATLRDESDQ